MSSDLVSLLKRVSLDAVNAGYPCNWLVGIVVSVKPLAVQIEQQEIIPEQFLWLTDAVRDYAVDISVSHLTENRAGGGGYAEYASHNHDYKGRKKITVHNELQVGEAVYLLQKQGGQGFLILGRVGLHTNLSGQWL